MERPEGYVLAGWQFGLRSPPIITEEAASEPSGFHNPTRDGLLIE